MSNFIGDVGSFLSTRAAGSLGGVQVTKKGQGSLDMTDFLTQIGRAHV